MKKIVCLISFLILNLVTPFLVAGCSEKPTATISFNTGFDDVKVCAITLEVGKSLTPPEVPTKEGFSFVSWMKDGVKYEFDKMPEENIELTAEWLSLEYCEDVLPCMTIDLYDDEGTEYPLDSVERENYVKSKISILNTEEMYEINNVDAEFKGRGNGSWFGAGGKNGYRIKFKKKQGLFGQEESKHWVIIACANFQDTTMSRNYLAYNMTNSIFSNIEYTTKAQWIDVYINGNYHGVYLLCEHVRVDEGRVDIDSEYGVKDTGYLIEYDSYATGEEGVDYFKIDGIKYPFTVKSPDPEDYLEEDITKEQYMLQVEFIKDYVQNVYDAALNHDFEKFSNLVDVDSFVDMYLLHELFKNVDTGWSSFYMYKKPNGKLFAGPVWDFDATTNIGERGDRTPQGIYVAEDVLSGSDYTSSELYIELYKTEEFLMAVKTRWQQISHEISLFIDDKLNEDVYEKYQKCMGKNFVLWDKKLQSNAEIEWVNDCRILKHWFRDRIEWLNKHWRLT